ncbi:52 kDa repressor of the inhibitor of the protein kinase [Cyphomyrmex costatus]|uniref:52 kDa repressor of the inhibitor of the protein kinase n=1 Tax=Cyphomyrmex costatus TaxID=456900 RepID=A0A195D321_9HYME|nr:52 kDa repressor of the inhibitor of the protein kinase [Cyphomyrmex costatus]
MGGYSCAVKDCKNVTGTKGVSFFRFPKDPKVIWIRFPFRAKLWLQFCNRCIETTLEKLNNNYRICSEHFTPSMFLNNLRNRLQSHMQFQQ